MKQILWNSEQETNTADVIGCGQELNVEEALVNCLLAVEAMTGANNLTVHAILHDRLRSIFLRYIRLSEDQ
ncbi:MAG: hypothetical protein IIB76_09110 [Proteobacteria bacterium]|nr:hypothetical protein [Pseudomonadota bacterium]